VNRQETISGVFFAKLSLLWVITFTLVYFSLSTSAFAADTLDLNNLPVLNDHLSGIISPEKEQEIGQLLIRQIRAQLPVLTAPLSSEYLRSLSNRISANSE